MIFSHRFTYTGVNVTEFVYPQERFRESITCMGSIWVSWVLIKMLFLIPYLTHSFGGGNPLLKLLLRRYIGCDFVLPSIFRLFTYVHEQYAPIPKMPKLRTRCYLKSYEHWKFQNLETQDPVPIWIMPKKKWLKRRQHSSKLFLIWDPVYFDISPTDFSWKLHLPKI